MRMNQDPVKVAAVVRRLVPSVAALDARRVIALALLPAAQVEALRVLLTGPATVRELADVLGWDPARTGRDLRLLETAGYARRHDGEHGAVWSALEPRGRR